MRPFDVITAPQRSEAWFTARLGRLCASDAPKMAATVQKGEAADRRDLRMRLVCERLTGRPAAEPYTNSDMERGVELEPQARIAYEFATGLSVQQTGFLSHHEFMVGASPDGVIGDYEGLVEIKCPRSARHLSYLRDGVVPTKYLPQLLHQLWVSGAGYVDFASFDPEMPERLQLFVVRLERDEAAIEAYRKKALAFLGEVDREESAIRTITNPGAQMAAALGAA